jgi:hypothetical protein
MTTRASTPAAHAFHVQVEQYEIGVSALGQLHGLFTGRRFAGKHQIVVHRDELRDALSK